MKKVANATVALVISAAGIGLGLLYIDSGWTTPTVILSIVIFIMLVASGVGWRLVARYPVAGGLLMEASMFGSVLLAAVGSGLVLWTFVRFSPATNSSVHDQVTWTAFSGAISVWLAVLALSPDSGIWSLVPLGIKRKFTGKFSARATDYQRDADDATRTESYGAIAHEGQVVKGWTWTSRRLRLRHLADANR